MVSGTANLSCLPNSFKLGAKRPIAPSPSEIYYSEHKISFMERPLTTGTALVALIAVYKTPGRCRIAMIVLENVRRKHVGSGGTGCGDYPKPVEELGCGWNHHQEVHR